MTTRTQNRGCAQEHKGKGPEKQVKVPEALEFFQMLSHISGVDRRENESKAISKGDNDQRRSGLGGWGEVRADRRVEGRETYSWDAE